MLIAGIFQPEIITIPDVKLFGHRIIFRYSAAVVRLERRQGRTASVKSRHDSELGTNSKFISGTFTLTFLNADEEFLVG